MNPDTDTVCPCELNSDNNNVCPDCGFDSDDELEYAHHRRDRHLALAYVFADRHAYDVWLEGTNAA